MCRHISAGRTVAGAHGNPRLLGQGGLWSCREEPQGNLSSQSHQHVQPVDEKLQSKSFCFPPKTFKNWGKHEINPWGFHSEIPLPTISPIAGGVLHSVHLDGF